MHLKPSVRRGGNEGGSIESKEATAGAISSRVLPARNRGTEDEEPRLDGVGREAPLSPGGAVSPAPFIEDAMRPMHVKAGKAPRPELPHRPAG